MRASKKSRKPKAPPPELDLRVVTLGGVDYFIYWEQLNVGHSFFMPTLMAANDVARALRYIEKKMSIRLEVRNRCEHGAYGVRVWRVL